MLDLRWLSDQLCDALRWQLTNPGSEDGPTSQPVSFGIDPAIELIKTFHRTPRVSKSDLLHPRMQSLYAETLAEFLGWNLRVPVLTQRAPWIRFDGWPQ